MKIMDMPTFSSIVSFKHDNFKTKSRSFFSHLHAVLKLGDYI